MAKDRNRVCPVELASGLDGKLRRFLQNPHKILAPYLRQGMTALDLGCGPGFFSIEMAEMIGDSGRVIAADLQDGMLELLRGKIRGSLLEKRIKTVRCDKDKINVTDTVDFILTFYMVHEVPDKNSFFAQLYHILRENGELLLVEPKLFHVSRKEFELTLQLAEKCGFQRHPAPPLALSWTAILRKAGTGRSNSN